VFIRVYPCPSVVKNLPHYSPFVVKNYLSPDIP